MIDFKSPYLNKISQHKKDSIALIFNDTCISYGELLSLVANNIKLLESYSDNVVAIIGDFDIQTISFF